MDRWATAAIAHVRALAHGGPAPRDLDVDVHLHPDRMVGGRTVVEALVADGVYRSQWETGTSNGGLTATPGGASVDMRSASINAPHDFGSNGSRIEDFMIALDNEVTTLLRDNPNPAQPTPEDDEPAPPVEGE